MFKLSSRTLTSAALALGIAFAATGSAMATAPNLLSLQKPAVQNYTPVQLTANSLRAPGGSSRQKICTNTYHAGGIRCTFCYYTTQPGSGSTVCIKIKTPTN